MATDLSLIKEIEFYQDALNHMFDDMLVFHEERYRDTENISTLQRAINNEVELLKGV